MKFNFGNRRGVSKLKPCVSCKENFFAITGNQHYCIACKKIRDAISLKERSKKFRLGNEELCRQRVIKSREKKKNLDKKYE